MRSGVERSTAALFDLDGTLVDSNYQHALAWFRALRRHEIVVPVWRIHRHIGMGGDQIVAALAGEAVEARLGDRLRAAEHEEFLRMRDECEPLAEAAGLLQDLHARGVTIILASSASEDDVKHFLGRLDAGDVFDGWKNGDDVAHSKPHPRHRQCGARQERRCRRGRSCWAIPLGHRGGCERRRPDGLRLPAAGLNRNSAMRRRGGLDLAGRSPTADRRNAALLPLNSQRPRCASRPRDLTRVFDSALRELSPMYFAIGG